MDESPRSRSNIVIRVRCQGCGGPLVSSRVRWWERVLSRMTPRRPCRCAYCYKRRWIIPDGSEQLPHAVQEIAAWPTRDVSFDPASLDSPVRSLALAPVRRQTADVPMRKAGDVDCEVIISITSSLPAAAVTSLQVRPGARATWSHDWADVSKPSSAATSERPSIRRNASSS